MNLLAHALLSPPNPGILTGNITADWIKGRARHALPPNLRTGVALHRQIDVFTDTHALVEHCSNLLSDRWNRYAPVLVDIFFDHVLCCQWSRYSPTPRDQFIQSTYTSLRTHKHLLPERAQYGANALLADDWFTCYTTLDGIALSLSRLSSRLHHGIELAPAVADFLTHQDAFTTAFNEFFPQLRRFLETHPPAAPPAEVH